VNEREQSKYKVVEDDYWHRLRAIWAELGVATALAMANAEKPRIASSTIHNKARRFLLLGATSRLLCLAPHFRYRTHFAGKTRAQLTVAINSATEKLFHKRDDTVILPA
jgi:hypothetical protein